MTFWHVISKKLKSRFLNLKKRKIRILEHCLSSVDNELGWVTVDGCGWVGWGLSWVAEMNPCPAVQWRVAAAGQWYTMTSWNAPLLNPGICRTPLACKCLAPRPLPYITGVCRLVTTSLWRRWWSRPNLAAFWPARPGSADTYAPADDAAHTAVEIQW